MGSANETEYLTLLCADLEYFSQEVRDKLLSEIQEIKKMLSTLINKLRNK